MSDLRIGVVALANRSKGLWKDALTAAWAAEKTGFVSIFAIPDFHSLYFHPEFTTACSAPVGIRHAVEAGMRYLEWLKNIEVLICFEQLLPAAFLRAVALGVAVAFVPNLDWATLYAEDDVTRWLAVLREAPVRVWARTPMIEQTLRTHGVHVVSMPWSIADTVREHSLADTPRRFVFNGGLAGWRNRRGLDTLLASFPMVRSVVPDATLTIKVIQPLQAESDGVSVSTGWWREEEIDQLYSSADAVVHPSRWEGFGLPQMEALHRGVPVIATSGWPMSELMEDLGGMPIPCRKAGTVRLATHWECDPQDLAAAMVRLCTEPVACHEARPKSSLILARQQEFLAHFQRETTEMVTNRARSA